MILKSEINTQELKTDGFTIVQLLSDIELKNLNEFYLEYSLKVSISDYTHITFFEKDNDFKKNVSNKLVSLIKNNLDEHFFDYKVIQSAFIIKKAESLNSTVYSHQDWSFVDELNGEESYTLWIALVDIKSDMGQIGLIKGSHKNGYQIRYTPDSIYQPNPYTKEIFGKEFTYIELKAGEAILWNNKTVHRSGVNKSKNNRINIAFGLTSKDSKLKLHWKSPTSNKILQFDVDDDFYFRNNSITLLKYYKEGKNPEDLTPFREISTHESFIVESMKELDDFKESQFLNTNKIAYESIKENFLKFNHFSTFEYYPEFELKKDKSWHYTYPSPFIHANVMYALINSENKELASLGVPFLNDISINQSIWSFCNAESFQHTLPPDVDDTALASYMLSKFGYEINNKSLLIDNIEKNGDIKTWIKNKYNLLLKQPRLFFYFRKKEEYIAKTLKLGIFNWDDNEVGVAANVLMYLGERSETKKAIKKCIDDWRNNVPGQYYDKKIIVAYHLARAYNEGIKSFEIIKDEIKEYVEQEIDTFEFAELLLSALILSYFDKVETPLGMNIRKRIINTIINEDPENLFYHYPYFTSKDRIFFAGSSSLTAAWFLEVVSYWNIEKNI